MKKTIILFFLLSFFVNAQEKFSVYFDFDKSELNQKAINTLNSWIAEGKNYQVQKLYGFCDSKGTNIYNDSLAIKRVNIVYNYLKKNNIEVIKDIEIRGFGEDFLQSLIQDENRRVTIIYQQKKETLVTKPTTIKDNFATTQKGQTIILTDFKFYNNSAKMLPKSEPYLYDLLCVLNDNPNLKIEIQGHICCKNPTQIDPVSQARAKTVYNYLVQNKINRKRLTYKGYGVSRPIHPIPEKNEQEEDENRRVEILILEN